LALLLAACRKLPPPTLEPAAVIPCRTTDGWELDLRRYPGPGEPVLLVHGMGANHGLGHRLGRIALHWARPWRG